MKNKFFNGKEELVAYVMVLAEKEILAGGEILTSVKEKEWAVFVPGRYHATLDFEFSGGTGFRLDMWGNIDSNILHNVSWNQSLYVYAGSCPYGYMDFSKKYVLKKKRPTPEEAEAVATCNFVGHNCFNPFGLMDR